MTLGYEAAALGAALTWAVGGLVAAAPTKALGGPRFTRLRMYWVAVCLTVIATSVGEWDSLGLRQLILLGASGVVGLALGDVALFTAFSRLGPRRTGILFAANAPMAAMASAVLFDERFPPTALAGSILVVAGVMLAIGFGTRSDQRHHWEAIHGNVWVGVAFGLLGAARRRRLGRSSPGRRGNGDDCSLSVARCPSHVARALANGLGAWLGREDGVLIPPPPQVGEARWGVSNPKGSLRVPVLPPEHQNTGTR